MVENAIGRSTDEALGAARERVSTLWGGAGERGEAGAADAGDGVPASGEAPSPAPPALPADLAADVRATLARAEQALDAAPADDREEMINLMEDLRDAAQDGRAEQAAELRQRARRDPLLPGIGDSGAGDVERCPTCGARHAGGPSCHRCRTDLRQVLAIERAAARRRRRARAALERGDRREARAHAGRACALHRSPESLAVLALAALADTRLPRGAPAVAGDPRRVRSG